jgi:hypothetical protein
MKMSLQMGSGMMGHAKDLVSKWGEGELVLSPRDLKEDKMIKFSSDIHNLGGTLCIDPQCFIRNLDHNKLTSHKFWTSFKSVETNALINASSSPMLSDLKELNDKVGTSKFIVPCIMLDSNDDMYIKVLENLIDISTSIIKDKEIYATIALSESFVDNENEIEALIDRLSKWQVDGIYLLAESPSGYLIDDPVWLGNLLLLCAGIFISGKKVTLGYSNHQMLCSAVAGVDTIASGNHLNTRSFSTNRFFKSDNKQQIRKSVWYYSPSIMNEYKLEFMDLALRVGLLDLMKPSDRYSMRYSSDLFQGRRPSSVDWGERNSFRHYLYNLKIQAESVDGESYEKCKYKYINMLSDAKNKIKTLHARSIRGGNRDFDQYIDVNNGALELLDSGRGPWLSKKWKNI